MSQKAMKDQVPTLAGFIYSPLRGLTRKNAHPATAHRVIPERPN